MPPPSPLFLLTFFDKKILKLSQEFVCTTPVGVYRRLSTAKNAGKQLSTKIFCGTGFYKHREKKLQRKEKR